MREHAWGRYHVFDRSARQSERTTHGAATGTGSGMRARRRIGVVLFSAALVSGGCARVLQPNPTPAADRDWPRTLAASQERAGRGDFDGADSLLGQFARRHAGTRPANEAMFWQAVFRLDPSNRNGSITSGLATLDAYLADPRPHDHAMEAMTLRRVAAQLDAANRLVASASTAAHEPGTPATKPATDARSESRTAYANDAEIKRLKDELAKANAELERIKRRLAQPPGKH